MKRDCVTSKKSLKKINDNQKPKEKGQKDKHWSPKTLHKQTKDWAKPAPLKTGGELNQHHQKQGVS